MDAPLAFLDSRRSVPASQLAGPAPGHDALLRMLHSASRVPDHGKRVPFRFLRIEGEARIALSARIVERSREIHPDIGEAALEKDRMRFQRAPLIVVVIARQGEDAKIPASERFSTASCVCFALLQAAQALGYGAQWLTGWPAYDRGILRTLGVGEDECVAGFIHIGTAQAEAPERDRPDPAALLSDLRL
ncbi:nitroreductase [Pseudoluteimonas lycopersici]|uniref:Putative NAD(P)H nitroreductase n=1 Tax=Pseudoluteimonas lycopersici TaxID=1324796 RepID=A0A516V846_9GAMM|nr:nitroreductase [Lysobacter lycopersici]QDQ74644.1 nitroreductase [Lysobacter lycopersici]